MLNPVAQRFTSRWQYRLAAFFVLLVLVLIVAEWSYMKVWEGQIVPEVLFGSTSLGGHTRQHATNALQETVDALHDRGIEYIYQTETITLRPIVTSPSDPDLTYDLARWDIDAMVNDAFAIGRKGSLIERWIEQTKTLLSPRILPARVTVYDDRLRETIQDNFQQFENPARNATLVASGAATRVEPERIGRRINTEDAIRQTRDRLERFSSEPIQLSLMTEYPRITATDLEPFRIEAAAIIKNGAITLTHGSRWWRVHPEEFVSWFDVRGDNGTLQLHIDRTAARAYMETLAKEIDRPARDAKFSLTGKRVSEFQTAREGEKLNLDETLDRFEKNVLREHTVQVALVIETLAPTVADTDINTLGITERIGVGTSNFAGSPANRRHNIAVGAKALHGVLIAPDEEFSLLKTLGPIDETSGYKTELVIKGNRTIPEYGGGLCQIGTTTFRAAMDSGLPITERRNHSYAVSYYFENGKPGTDATIYGPKPDFRFMNDTGNYILIQTRIEKDEVIFEFWGKKDGRAANRTEPRVWNVRKPPPTQIIETEDLPPGQKKCTEVAHNGMNAEFTYTVTMPDGASREQIFRSSYRPWQAVCLVGKEVAKEASSE